MQSLFNKFSPWRLKPIEMQKQIMNSYYSEYLQMNLKHEVFRNAQSWMSCKIIKIKVFQEVLLKK